MVLPKGVMIHYRNLWRIKYLKLFQVSTNRLIRVNLRYKFYLLKQIMNLLHEEKVMSSIQKNKCLIFILIWFYRLSYYVMEQIYEVTGRPPCCYTFRGQPKNQYSDYCRFVDHLYSGNFQEITNDFISHTYS